MGLPPLGPTDPRFSDHYPWNHDQPRRFRLGALPLGAVAHGAVLALPLCVVLFVAVLVSPKAGPPAQTVPVATYAADLEARAALRALGADDAKAATDELAKLNTRVAREPADQPPKDPDDFDDLSEGPADHQDQRPPASKADKRSHPKKVQPKRATSRGSTAKRPSSQFLSELARRNKLEKRRAQRRSRRAPKSRAVRF